MLSFLSIKARVTAGFSWALLIFQQKIVRIQRPSKSKPYLPVIKSIVRIAVAKNSRVSFDEENFNLSQKVIWASIVIIIKSVPKWSNFNFK